MLWRPSSALVASEVGITLTHEAASGSKQPPRRFELRACFLCDPQHDARNLPRARRVSTVFGSAEYLTDQNPWHLHPPCLLFMRCAALHLLKSIPHVPPFTKDRASRRRKHGGRHGQQEICDAPA